MASGSAPGVNRITPGREVAVKRRGELADLRQSELVDPALAAAARESLVPGAEAGEALGRRPVVLDSVVQ